MQYIPACPKKSSLEITVWICSHRPIALSNPVQSITIYCNFTFSFDLFSLKHWKRLIISRTCDNYLRIFHNFLLTICYGTGAATWCSFGSVSMISMYRIFKKSIICNRSYATNKLTLGSWEKKISLKRQSRVIFEPAYFPPNNTALAPWW
jgi:hypothetical protein